MLKHTSLNELIFSTKVLIAALAFFVSSTVIGDESYSQTPLTLKASEVLPAGTLKGLAYEVDDEVINDGLVNIYTITSDYGNFEAEGTAELRMRIAEIKAIGLMEEMDKKEVFGDSLKAGVKAPFKGAAALVTEPVETGKAAAKGVGQMLSNIGRSFVSDDPDQDNALSVAVGYDAVKRKFAHELDVNPYSDNEIFRDQLGKVSKAAVAGGIAPRLAMAAVDSTVITVARLTGTTKAMKELVRDNPPGKLDKINRKKLEAMGVSDSLAEEFIDNYTYDPFEETLLVGGLEAMQGVAGRANFIAVANKATESSVARYYRLMVQMIEQYHTNIKVVKEIRNIEGVIHLFSEDGVVVIIAPVDYVFWTPGLDNKLYDFDSALREVEGIKSKEIWVAGQFDKIPCQQLINNGWKVIENAEVTLSK